MLNQTQLAAIQQPTGTGTGLPNHAYTSAEFMQAERDTLFANTWTCIGFASDLPESSYAYPLDFMGLPLLLVRDQQGVIRVFHNVCSHRGHMLVNEPGPVKTVMRCPYHSWTYALDGQLRGTPHVGGVGVHEHPEFDPAKRGLKPVRATTWLDMVFINLSGTAPAFNQHIDPLLERWQPFWGEQGYENLVPDPKGHVDLTVQSNWKLPVENYCEAYHLPWIHPGLNSYSRLEDHYHIFADDLFAGQGSTAYKLPAVADIPIPRFPDWPSQLAHNAEYIALFPNVLLGLQIDHYYSVLLTPLAADRTLEQMRIYYVGDEGIREELTETRATITEAWRTVFAEDVGAVEGMQRGRASPGFEGGAFSPVMDTPTHYFHKWAAAQLS